MADRDWFVEDIQLEEEGTEEYFVEGININEDQAAAVGGRIMSSLTRHGGLVGAGGILGKGGGLAG